MPEFEKGGEVREGVLSGPLAMFYYFSFNQIKTKASIQRRINKDVRQVKYEESGPQGQETRKNLSSKPHIRNNL